MATKVIFADSILKSKGIKKKQFDTGVFNEVVKNFFMEHEAKETILLTPKRFVEMENPPEGDFIDMLDTSIWEKKVDDPEDPFDFIDYNMMLQKGLIRPMLIVNEPFIGNASAYLRICGLNVKSRTRKKKKEYIVSLPI
nr:MAG TPA: hypothetical protein [Caudoviricetes sp.]